jgi:cell division septal protein FtsQ
LSFSHYFSIKNIDIIRQDDIINIDLSYKSIENIRYKPILFQDKEEIKSRLMTYQPNIKYIYIRKILPDNIKIILSSYKDSFRFEKD